MRLGGTELVALGLPHAVQCLYAKAPGPFTRGLGQQRLTRAQAIPQRAQVIFLFRILHREHVPVDGGRTHKNTEFVLLDEFEGPFRNKTWISKDRCGSSPSECK